MGRCRGRDKGVLITDLENIRDKRMDLKNKYLGGLPIDLGAG